MLNLSLRPPAPWSRGKVPPLLESRGGALDKLMALDRLRALYERVRTQPAESVFDAILRQLRVSYSVDPKDLAAIPRRGSVIIVANHPFGMLEGVVLGALLSTIRDDVRILTNHLLGGLPEFADRLILVDPFEPKRQASANSKGLREAVRWLKADGMLVTFPAGEVSHWDLREHVPSDPAWSADIARLARVAGASILPVYFEGANSIPFYLLGLMHPLLRTARLPEELLNKAGKRVEIRIGSTIPHSRIAKVTCDEEVTRYIRWRTYLLAKRERTSLPDACSSRGAVPSKETATADLDLEVSNLPAANRLLDSDEYAVFIADANRIPGVLREIGRLREITFRQAGEGTGREIDVDPFDAYYRHLFLWHKTRCEVVGAYRIGRTLEILGSRGIDGLYTSTLFQYDTRFFKRIGPALELGRSFVRLEYQKQFLPLLLLWKGLAAVVARDPRTPVLFGAVSISKAYSSVSRRLLAQFFRSQQAHDLRQLLKPRRPFHSGRSEDSIARLCRDLEGLSAAIGDIESDRKGVPILLEQYCKLGGQIVEFNVDPNFSDCLDALVVVDLRQTHSAMLARLMGRDAAQDFLREHQMLAQSA